MITKRAGEGVERRPRSAAVVLALLAVVAGCKGITLAPEAGEGGEAAPGQKVVAAPRGGTVGEVTLDVERYDLVGEFDWATETLRASVTVTLSAAHAPPAQVELDSRVSVHEVRLASGEALPFSVDAGAAKVTIELGEHAAPGAAFVIDYDAATPLPLFPTTPLNVFNAREGDPNPSRVAYTFAEPEHARDWLPSHDEPADRAYFSIDLQVGEGEQLVANGDLVEDSTGGGERDGRMKYATSYSLPTYLMAFALGEFEVEKKKGPHGLPLSIWHRRGLPGDYHDTLGELARLVRLFEDLTGVPYPFEKYALVLVPDINGEEHASVSFQNESSTAHPELGDDALVTVHELAHQWFGDLVTISSWDDLWIKEGLATMLEAEGVRKHIDRDGRGLFNGDRYTPFPGEAVRDPALPPEGKYNSGSYERSAWLLTQVRAIVGEDAFWGALRQVLTEHRFGSVDRDAFLEPFRASLGDEGLARVRQATEASGTPTLRVESLEAGARVTVNDPEATIVAPMSVAWYRADGSVETIELAPGVPTDIVPESPDDMLIVDPPNVHPDWASLLDEESFDAYYGSLAPLRVPTAAQHGRFLEAGGAHQIAVLLDSGLPPSTTADEFGDFVDGLDADEARALAVNAACANAAFEGGDWVKAARRAIRHRGPFTYGMNLVNYRACAEVLPAEGLFPAKWSKLLTGLEEPLLGEVEVEYLSKLSAPTNGENLSIWSAVFENGYSGRVRRVAASALVSHSLAVGAAERPLWRDHLAGLLASTGVYDVAFPLVIRLRSMGGPTAADNAVVLDAFSTSLHRVSLQNAHRFLACGARRLVRGDEAAWAEFVESVEDAELGAPVRALIETPTPC